MVTDYTVSYNNPMSGSFKVDHRTKTAFYLEAFLAQQKKLGRDYLVEGYATRAWSRTGAKFAERDLPHERRPDRARCWVEAVFADPTPSPVTP
jgi:hypothetical protein